MSDNDQTQTDDATLRTQMAQYRWLRYGCSLCGGLAFIFGIGIKDNGSPIALLAAVMCLAIGYALLRMERGIKKVLAERAAAAAPPAPAP